MNYIRHLNGFFNRAAADNNLSATHISLYMALFQCWNYDRFGDVFTVRRNSIMQLGKLGSKNTYHRCIKQLHTAGYIRYYPGLRKGQPAKVSMRRFDLLPHENDEAQLVLFNTEKPPLPRTRKGTAPVPELTHSSTGTGTSPVPEVGHFIKHINSKQINSVLNTPTQNFTSNEEKKGNTASPAAGSKPVHDAPPPGNTFPTTADKQKRDRPSYLQVESFFLRNAYPKEEALKFWLYNEGRGWMLTEANPVYQWEPLAHKWMLNPSTRETAYAKANLYTNKEKNYDAPL